MLGAFLAVLCWSVGSLATARAARRAGAGVTNVLRLLLALALLLGWVAMTGPGSAFSFAATRWWLIASGVIGLGLGDFAMMAAYRRIGPRLGVLILLCLAVPFAGLLEWLWRDTTISLAQAILMLAILLGVALAVAPSRDRLPPADQQTRAIGLAWALASAVAQGFAVAMTRVAVLAGDNAGLTLTAQGATLLRLFGGLPCALLLLPLARREMGGHTPSRATMRKAMPAILAATLLGPVIGLACQQWSLLSVPGAIVQAITSLTPAVVIPLTWLTEGDRPGWRGIVGGLGATAAAVGLACL